ncbi:INO80 complex subunit C [Columba livia]|uniref:INO80 complex subunit C n=1 Tax=Columba livia TaxID=8932 RepID=A0A2I0MWI4_COLLI|nr:INO80 complex subunit C [Columba livia]
MWKKGQATWEEYKVVVRVRRDAVSEAKFHLELNLAKDIKDNKKGFFKYISSKRKVRENVGPLLIGVGAMLMDDRKKAELLNAAFAAIFTAKTSPRVSQTLGAGDKVWQKEDLLLVKEDQSAGGEAMNENKFLNTDSSTGSVETTVKPLPFKDPNFIHSGIGGAAAGKKNRTWKNLKQILASERALPWQLNDPSYFNIDAPPSFKPAKKYSDISGLPANYTDPQSKLRFSTIEEFAYIRMLPSDVVTGYLALRKATSIVS